MGVCASNNSTDDSTTETKLKPSLGSATDSIPTFPPFFGGSNLTGDVWIQCCGTSYTDNCVDVDATLTDTNKDLSTVPSPTTLRSLTPWRIGVDSVSTQTFIVSSYTTGPTGSWYCWAMDSSITTNNNTTPPTVSVNYTSSCNGSSNVEPTGNSKWQFRSVMGPTSPSNFALYFKIRNVGRGRYLKCDSSGNLATAGGFGNGSGQLISLVSFCFFF